MRLKLALRGRSQELPRLPAMPAWRSYSLPPLESLPLTATQNSASSSRQRRSARSSGQHQATRVFHVIKDGEPPDDEAALELTSANINEIRQLKRPPDVVRRMLEVVHYVLNAAAFVDGSSFRAGWSDVSRTLASERLEQSMQGYDVDILQSRAELCNFLILKYFAPEPHSMMEQLTVERVQHASQAAVALFAWSTDVLKKAGLDVPTVRVQRRRPKRSKSKLQSKLSSSKPPPKLRAVYLWATCSGDHGLSVADDVATISCDVCGLDKSERSDPWAEVDEELRVRQPSPVRCELCNLCICRTCLHSTNCEACLEWPTGTEPLSADLHWLKKGEALPVEAPANQLKPGGMIAWWPRIASSGKRAGVEEWMHLTVRIGHLKYVARVQSVAAVSSHDVSRGLTSTPELKSPRPAQGVPLMGLFRWSSATKVKEGGDESDEDDAIVIGDARIV